jgi:penicillin-binding protein 1C
MDYAMDENEKDQIKPAEYQELGAFQETPGYTPALDPVSKFETFEGYGSEDLRDPLAKMEEAAEPNPEPEQAPEPEPTIDPEPETTADSSFFTELTGFKEVDTLPEPDWESEEITDFSTGHWAVDQKTQSEALQTVMEPDQPETILNSDDIPTIPPMPEDVPQVSKPEAEPLPQAVELVDPHATVLASTAFANNVDQATEGTQPVLTSHTQPKKITSETKIQPAAGANGKKVKKAKPPKNGKKSGCFGKTLLIGAIVFLLVMMGVAAFAIYKYFDIAKTLPAVDELQNRASQFETTRILDRNGNILYEIVDPNAGKRTYVPLERISPYVIAATIATEDKEYYNHPGFDLVALARALYTNYTSGEIVSGASTITQQLARMLLLTDERFVQSYERKAREIILAAEITRRYTKEQVLELYLNEIFYGNFSYGIEAAAETYFNTTAADLTLWQSSFLAGLPQAPAEYDIYNNREATLNRNKTVLLLMYQLSNEKGCIEIGENLEPVFLDAMQTLEAANILEAYEFTKRDFVMEFPHWVVFIQSLLESQFDSQTIYRSGFTIYTTLDPNLQRQAEKAVRDQLALMTGNNATNGAVIAMDPKTGEILSMVGSADFNNPEISGQVNMALTQTRQPGSAIKPLTYLAAFEKDWTPGTLIWDVPASFAPSGDPNDTNPRYEPVNYDGRFHGPVTVRDALANSYNIPAVKALEYVGIYDDPTTPNPDGFINLARRLGISSLNRPDYGLSLTLGGGEVSLLELTGAYQVLANEGRKVAPVAITKVIDHKGNVIYEYVPSNGEQIVRAAHAYLLSSILSDNNARAPMFGTNSVLALPFQAAVKTGTTNDYRDNWTVGYTPDLVVGVWVGNADYTPMVNTSGVSGAAPIWANIMQSGIQQLRGGSASSFGRPSDVVDMTICSVSGTVPSEYCPSQRTEVFASDQGPLPAEEDLWVKSMIDSWTGLQASPACSEFTKEALTINVEDKDAIKWLKTDAGKAWADKYGFPDPLVIKPERECRLDDPRPIIDLVNLQNPITENPFQVVGVVDATANFKQYKLHWGEGENPTQWNALQEDWIMTPMRSAGVLAEWDVSELDGKTITLRVTLHSTQNTEVQKKYTLFFTLPTPTPSPTPTPTETPTVTPTPTLTPTPTAPPDEPTPTEETP